MLTVILTGLGSRFSRPIHSYFNGLRVRGDLRWRRGHGDGQRETLPCNHNAEECYLSKYFYFFFLSLFFLFFL